VAVDDQQRHRHLAEEMACDAAVEVRVLVAAATDNEQSGRPLGEMMGEPAADADWVADRRGRDGRKVGVDVPLEGGQVLVGAPGGPCDRVKCDGRRMSSGTGSKTVTSLSGAANCRAHGIAVSSNGRGSPTPSRATTMSVASSREPSVPTTTNG
jgi:hypothetical protein